MCLVEDLTKRIGPRVRLIAMALAVLLAVAGIANSVNIIDGFNGLASMHWA